MKKLEKEFDKNNFHHRQIHRDGQFAIYERYWIPSEGEHKHWEVIKILKQNARTFPNGTHYPEQEAYPSDNTWGTYGFTCTSKEAAYKRLESMMNEN